MVYDMAWWASHGICIGLARCVMVYVILWWGMACYMVWPVEHDIVYRMAWQGMARYMVWPGGMTCIWYGLAFMAWYMLWSNGHGTLYGVVCRACHGLWCSLVSIVLYMYWPVEVWHGIGYTLMGYGMLYGMACRA